MKLILIAIILLSFSILEADPIKSNTTRNRRTEIEDADGENRVKRESPLIGKPKNKTYENRYLSIGLTVANLMSNFIQEINQVNPDLIYPEWAELDGGNHTQFGLDVKVRLPFNDGSFRENVWLSFGIAGGTVLYQTPIAQNRYYDLDGSGTPTYIDHQMEYEMSYMAYHFGAMYVIELIDNKLSLNPRFNINFMNPDVIEVTENDKLNNASEVFSNGRNLLETSYKEYTNSNLITLQPGAELEYRFTSNISGIGGAYYNIPLSDAINNVSLNDRTGQLSNSVVLKNRGLANNLQIYFVAQWNF